MAAPFAGRHGRPAAGSPDVDFWGPDLYFGQLARSGGNALQALTIVPVPDLRLVELRGRRRGRLVPVLRRRRTPGLGRDGRHRGHGAQLVGARHRRHRHVEHRSTRSRRCSTPRRTGGPSAPTPPTTTPTTRSGSRSAARPGNNRDIVFDLAVSAGNGGTGIAEPIVLTVQRGVEKGGILSAERDLDERQPLPGDREPARHARRHPDHRAGHPGPDRLRRSRSPSAASWSPAGPRRSGSRSPATPTAGGPSGSGAESPGDVRRIGPLSLRLDPRVLRRPRHLVGLGSPASRR